MDVQASLQPLIEKLQSWLEGAIAILPNMVVAVGVIALFVVLASVGRRITTRLAEQTDASVAITRLLSTIVQYSIVIAGFLVALGIVGLQKAVVSILAGAGVAGLAIGFAFQDLAANFIAGIAMGFRKPFAIGDIVRTNDFYGRVGDINMRNTVLRTFDGERVIIPNKDVFENPLINYNTNGTRRVEVDVGVGYDTDLEQATEIAREAAEALDFRAADTDVQVVSHEFGGSSINFKVRFWIDYPETNFVVARHQGVLAIKRAFDAADIEIPFPIRTLDLSAVADRFQPVVMQRGAEGDAGMSAEPAGAAA